MDDQHLPSPCSTFPLPLPFPSRMMTVTVTVMVTPASRPPAPQHGLQLDLADLQLGADLVEAVRAVEVAGETGGESGGGG